MQFAIDLCRLGGGTEPNIYAYFVGLRDRYTQPTILLTEPYWYIENLRCIFLQLKGARKIF
ncbi:hypothetical protein [Nostoc sp. FACHB-190]|uniref:hypothetical protein n=1 Tax=Nostoc sp. FACHB-190 TaxID=2692838 RepID=UPI001686DAB8|nr:hypothetical protein [Nostoc sp. FACHB-190]